MLSFTFKSAVVLSYWIAGCYLVFTEMTDPKIIFGVVSMSESLGTIFMGFALFILCTMGEKK